MFCLQKQIGYCGFQKLVNTNFLRYSTGESKNYFELLNSQPTFDLDLQKLKESYFSLQKQFHPDKFATKSAEEKKIASETSTHINEAYQTLKNAQSRAKYMLKLNSIVIEKEDSSEQNMELLMLVVEKRDIIEQARNVSDLQEIRTEVINEINKIFQNLTKYFGESNIKEAKLQTVRLNYFLRIQEAMEQKTEDLLKLNQQ